MRRKFKIEKKESMNINSIIYLIYILIKYGKEQFI